MKKRVKNRDKKRQMETNGPQWRQTETNGDIPLAGGSNFALLFRNTHQPSFINYQKNYHLLWQDQ